jgi:signal transduction histidine kinase/ActR/RegA family two-component response regulator
MSVLARLTIARDEDVVAARKLVRRATEILGYEDTEQVRIATAVSELAREALHHGGGSMVLDLEPSKLPTSIAVRVETAAPSSGSTGPDLAARSLAMARRLMGELRSDVLPSGAVVFRTRRALPKPWRSSDEPRVRHIAAELRGEQNPVDPYQELQRQNAELGVALESLRLRQEELERLNVELENTNRGVVALYAELDERAEELKRADEMKTRFLSDMSHEFRSPLNSILAISRLLAEETDGQLVDEQKKQVGFIQRASQQLYDLIDDLLDLARVEAGKTQLRIEPFDLDNLFRTLRGLTRPLLGDRSEVQLMIEDPPALEILSDEGKVSQILRNFLSNALKFTERGEVRLKAHAHSDGEIAFAVSDTGIGIAEADQSRVFTEFGQLDTALHRRVKGTGLGLALSRRLAQLLHGRIELVSAPGVGSTFTLFLPLAHADHAPHTADAGAPILVVEDEDAFRYIILEVLRRLGLPAIAVTDGSEALTALGTIPPQAVLLDLTMPRVDGFAVLEELRKRPESRDLPVVVVTSLELSSAQRETLRRGRAVLLPKRMLAGSNAAITLREALVDAGWRRPATEAAS